MAVKRLILMAICAVAALAQSSVWAVNPLKQLGSIINSVTSTSKFELEQIDGTWHYQSPAVSLKGEGALADIGGAAGAVAVEQKLAPYYNKLGLNTITMAFQHQDSIARFEMVVRRIKLHGTVSKNDDTGLLTFHFATFGGYNIGNVTAMCTKNVSNNLSLTFDVTGFVRIMSQVAAASKQPTAEALAAIVESYKQMYVGAKLKRTGSASFDN